MNYNKTDEIMALLRDYYRQNKDQLGIKRIGLFGSYSRGTRSSGGDIDILVDLEDESLESYNRMQGELELLLSEKISLHSLRLLKSSVRPYVLEEIIYV